MIPWRRLILLVLALGALFAPSARAQIDPIKRDLLQMGYNAAIEGHQPLAAYGFYYRNQPDFLETNLTLRLAIAPVYVDSELGIKQALGENTDFAVGLAGGAFADSYYEIDQGTYYPSQSFDGYSIEGNSSIYHLFNPGGLIPLNAMLRGIAHYSIYGRTDNTAPDFQLPPNHGTLAVRTGLRWGGREPTLYPALAMELSIWYEGQFRTDSGVYGFNDRRLEPHSHLFWSEALLAYTFPEAQNSFYVNVLGGMVADGDRFSAYRLGGFLPLSAEFPLTLPGYYYQELSARRFLLAGANYVQPVDPSRHWNLTVNLTTALVDYLPGLQQPGDWNNGVGGGIIYKSNSWKVMAGYAYGFEAIRSHGRGANSVGILMQLDLEKANLIQSTQPGLWRGVQNILNIFH